MIVVVASRHRWGAGLFRALFVALALLLALSLASSGMLPAAAAFARLVGIEARHVCHCSVERHECVCQTCHPDDDAGLVLGAETLRGRCGDDDGPFLFGKALGVAHRLVNGYEVAFSPIADRVSIVRPSVLAYASIALPPPTPPPRSSTFAV